MGCEGLNFATDHYTQKDDFKLFHPKLGLKITGNFNNLSDPSYYKPLGLLNNPGFPDIGISRGVRSRPLNSATIYGTVIHEVAHAGHHNKDFGFFYNLRIDGNRNERLVMAEGCQTMVTNDRYNRISPNWINSTVEGLGLNGERQFLAVEELFRHTPMVTDMIDDLNQGSVFQAMDLLQITERVEGYTLEQLKGTLKGERNLEDWKNSIIEDLINPSEVFLDDIFDYAKDAESRL
jgi:hypothetical protein